MDYKKKILNLKGEDMPKNFPTQKEISNLPKIENPSDPKGPKIPNIEKIDKETVGNVILNCLGMHRCENKKEGFYINLIAQHVIDPNAELKDKLKSFLIEVLEDSILKDEKKKDKDGNETVEQIGIYAGWIIAQVLKELGVEAGD